MKQLQKFSSDEIATSIAIVFHAIGLIGILQQQQFFIQATGFNLLLMFGLLIWTQKNKNLYFYFFLLTAVVTGIAVEVIGINTRMLFGNYTYGTVLGPQVKLVPLIIGVNWFIIVYCCGVTAATLLSSIIKQLPQQQTGSVKKIAVWSIIIDGATIAVFFDWVMEPVAIKLGYWKWHGDGSVPLYNYVCWFVISAMLLTVFYYSRFTKKNKFAVHLLMIQVMFFLLLRTFN